MTNAWVGSTDWTPDFALIHEFGTKTIAPHILALPGRKVMIDWVAIDTSSTDGFKHDVAVGSLLTGTFVPSAQEVIAQTLVPASGSALGCSHAQIDPSGGVFVVSWGDDGTGTCSFVMARMADDLTAMFSKTLDITDGFAEPYIRNMAAVVAGHYFRFTIGTDGVTATGIPLDSSFNDGAPASFTLDTSFPQIGGVGGEPMVSGNYVCFTRASLVQVVARVSGSAVVDMWTRTGSSTHIVGVFPGSPNDFVVTPGDNTCQRMTLNPDRSETLIGSPVSLTVGGNINEPSQIISGEYWSFLTGPSGGS